MTRNDPAAQVKAAPSRRRRRVAAFAGAEHAQKTQEMLVGHHILPSHPGSPPPTPERHTVPETTFHIPALQTQEDADAVMFELQDLPCVNQADVNLPERTAWVSHTRMIAPEDIAAALQEAGYEATLV